MKKMVLGLSLSLAALGFLMSPAMAASPPQVATLSAADQAFLASLGARVGTPAPELAAKRPAIGQKSFCSANCWDTGTVSCSGTSCSAVNGNCPSEPGHVTCDGITTWCPNPCPCDPDFCANEEADCAFTCDPCSYNFTCSESTCTSHCHCLIRTCPP